MYSYTWDEETGGILLNTTVQQFSKEPRPVYYKELDILGFDNYWKYEKDETKPYMWAEANNYIYKGKLVAKTKGGSIYTAPEVQIIDEPEPNNNPLQQVNIELMVEKNKTILSALEQATVKRIYNTYKKYKDKVDVFYVAFSGGKDSIVTLDLVQKTLPHSSFKVLFGDTRMEFPDTYKTVEKISEICKKQDIEFLTAKSKYDTDYTWKQFGPPATVNRWCCSVHKTSPQIIKLREVLNKHNFRGMAFIGVRSSESLARSTYDYLSLGEKHKGQFSCNPILEWNSAELYMYIYTNNLVINEAYKKGNRRAGCLVCPGSGERNDYMRRACYTESVDKYLNMIKSMYKKNIPQSDKMNEFIENVGWKARMNGRDLDLSQSYSDIITNNFHIITVSKPKTDWKVWIKTVGILLNNSSPYRILYKENEYSFLLENKEKGYEVKIDSYLFKKDPVFVKLLKNVFRKSASCILCQECEADCQYGNIKMNNEILEISDNCIHCAQCHKVEKGCLVYKSLEMPKGGSKIMSKKSLNCYSSHAPKKEWFNQFFKYKKDFDLNHTLGSQMFSFFKRFLRDAEIVDTKSNWSDFADKIDKLGLENDISWALMLVNLSYTPQIQWYINNIAQNETYTKEYLKSLIEENGANERAANDIWGAYGRILELPFHSVGLGEAIKEKNKFIALKRTPYENPEPLVILYALYKFAEKCNGYYQFTLTRLLNHEIESDGISPTKIFGISRESMEKILLGLSINYPEYINVSFTHDLDNITLKEHITSKEILSLF